MLMPIRILCIVAWPILGLLFACVPKPIHMGLEKELENARIQKAEIERKVNQLEIELEQSEKRIRDLEFALQKSDKLKNRYNKDLANMQRQYIIQKDINLQLSKRNSELAKNLNKKNSVIQLQEKVIRLLDDSKKTIETSLKDQIDTQEIEVIELEDKLKVVFVDKILFDSGSVNINPKGKELLLIMSDALKDNNKQQISVEGHTDNLPLGPFLLKRFPSNWELSTARAAAVVRFLSQEGGVEPERLSARGFSYYKPVATNKTEGGRRQNRRIEIILSSPK